MTSNESVNSRAVTQLMSELQADRARLAERTRAPKWLAPGFGLIAAAYVSAPALPAEQIGDFVLIAAAVAGILLIVNYQRTTGIKISRFGAREWGLFMASVVGSLVLLSISFGLAAAGLYWWIAVPGIAAFAMVMRLVSVIHSSMRERLRHVS